jgi:hypothetical protein
MAFVVSELVDQEIKIIRFESAKEALRPLIGMSDDYLVSGYATVIEHSPFTSSRNTTPCQNLRPRFDLEAKTSCGLTGRSQWVAPGLKYRLFPSIRRPQPWARRPRSALFELLAV